MDLRAEKKKQVFLLFAISRLSGLIIGHRVVTQRSIPAMQDWINQIKAHAQLTGLVYTDGFDPYKHLNYGLAHHQVGKGKSQTYSVEGFHAGTRHYLARLRRRTRCVTRSLTALQKAIDLYVFCHNTRKRKMNQENLKATQVHFTYALSLLS
jgi:IS1 family transposase